MTPAAAKGEKLFLLAAALLAAAAALLAPVSAEASRYLPQAVEPVQAPQASLEDLAGGDVDHHPALPALATADRLDLVDLAAGARLEARRLGLHLASGELGAAWKTASGGQTWLAEDNVRPISEMGVKTRRLIFQGLWTDPVTGLSYARARWYDARNASWLSEDPLLDVDSPNLYAFVGWGPHMATDPMGLADDWNYSMGGPKDPVVLAEKRRQAEDWCRAHPAECEAQNTRFAGGMMMAGSVLEGAGALGLCYTTGGLACAAGGSALLVHSFDTWETGRAMVRSGVPQETQTFRLFEQGYGTFLSPEHARTAARFTETLAPAVIGAGMARSALSAEVRANAAAVRLNLADDASLAPADEVPILGGRHRQTRVGGTEYGTQSHHLIADDASDIATNDALAIRMEIPDHRVSGTWGSRRSAVRMRAEQEALVKRGDYDDALQMGIDDITERFGDKYDLHLEQALESAPRRPDGTIDWDAFKR